MQKKLLFLGFVLALIGIKPSYAMVGENGGKKPAPQTSYKVEAGDCKVPASNYDLDINNVRAGLLNGGDLWYTDNSRYEVPKGDGITRGIQAIYAGAIWISGLDAAGNLKMAGTTFRTTGLDFFSGPLDNNGEVTQAVCSKWDKHFNVFGTEIGKLQAKYDAGQPISVGDVPDNVLYWPGKGNTYLAAKGYDMSNNLAPFFDRDNDGVYDPTKGDYPSINECDAYGDQMVFWVSNDKGNVHNSTSGNPLGVQVNSLAFAFTTADEINNMTFYSYNIINKGGSTLSKTYMSQFVDPDLGCYSDDRLGCDTLRSLGVVYNGKSNDLSNCSSGILGYGTNTPMLGFDFFEGPRDTNGVEKGLSSFNYFTGTGGAANQTDPNTAREFRNYQSGKWKDGSNITYGGTGIGGSTPTNYCFPGDPSVATEWSECNQQSGAAIPTGDRRMLLTSGPFTFLPNASQRITVGVLFVQPQGGTGLCPSFNSIIGPADDKAQALFRSCFKLIDGPSAPTLQIREMDKKLVINLINERSQNNFGESYDQVDASITTQTGFVFGMDSTYTFQGYKIYQILNDKVSATELDNPSKALLVQQMDVKDGVGRIINFEKDALTQLFVPKLKVDGEDKGVKHSLLVEKDMFTDGPLINNKTYYYSAIAYAHNSFKPYDQFFPANGGQQNAYLVGRKNFGRYSAIPHNEDSRNGGTQLNAVYGDGVEVKRIEGQGNGGNNIELNKNTIEKILSGAGFTDTLEYEKLFDPIGFRVIDPLSLREADFELQIFDTLPYNDYSVSNNAYWRLIDLTNRDTIKSERNLDKPYEQIISTDISGETVNYGFSLSVGTPVVKYDNKFSKRPIFGAITGTISYENAGKKWLSFVADNGQNSPANWIRSGKAVVATTDPLYTVFDDNWYTANGSGTISVPNPKIYTDPDKGFENIAGGTWAPYCLTSNYHFVGTPTKVEQPASIHNPGFKWDAWGKLPTASYIPAPPQNTLDRLQSVDIVFTSDKSKWSQCIVFETGEEDANTEGAALVGRNARKGQLRMALSKDKDGNNFNDPNTALPDTGRSWFPGYAINVETGQRLNIAFGESSEFTDENGRDMLWNPTSKVYGDLNYGGTIPNIPFFGGKHFVYVMETPYDGGQAMRDSLLALFRITPTNNTSAYPTGYADLYRQIMYTSIPYLSSGFKLNSLQDGVIPSEVTVKLRVQKPFTKFATNATNLADTVVFNRYQFSTIGIGPKENVAEVAKSALDKIRIVPNPYLAYSAYEKSAADTRVKITNLPNICTITVYAIDGTLIRTIKRSINTTDPDPQTGVPTEISEGNNIDRNPTNLDNSAEWDLKNEKNVPVASGVYLFVVDAPNIGSKTLKWFGAMRPADVSNF
jgi:hypothetical protein